MINSPLKQVNLYPKEEVTFSPDEIAAMPNVSNDVKFSSDELANMPTIETTEDVPAESRKDYYIIGDKKFTYSEFEEHNKKFNKGEISRPLLKEDVYVHPNGYQYYKSELQDLIDENAFDDNGDIIDTGGIWTRRDKKVGEKGWQKSLRPLTVEEYYKKAFKGGGKVYKFQDVVNIESDQELKGGQTVGLKDADIGIVGKRRGKLYHIPAGEDPAGLDADITSSFSKEEKLVKVLQPIFGDGVKDKDTQLFNADFDIDKALGKDETAENLFSMDEEEGVKAIENLFVGTNIEFSQSNLPSQYQAIESGEIEETFGTLGGETIVSDGFEFVKVQIPDAPPIYLEFNTDFRSESSQKNKNKENLVKLKNYLENNIDKVKFTKEWDFERERLEESYIKRIKEDILTPNVQDEIENVRKKYNLNENPDLFKPITKTRTVSTGDPMDAKYGIQLTEEYTTTAIGKEGEEIYENYIKKLESLPEDQIKNIRKNYNLEDDASISEIAKIFATQDLIDQKITEIKFKATENYIEKARGGFWQLNEKDGDILQAEIFSGGRIYEMKGQTEWNKFQGVKNIIQDQASEKNNYMVAVENYATNVYTTLEDEALLMKALNELNIFVNPLENIRRVETNIDENGNSITTVRNKAIEDNLKYLYAASRNSIISFNNVYNDILKEQDGIAEKFGDVQLYMEAASKNYDLSEKYIANIGLGTSDFVMGAGNLAYNIASVPVTLSVEALAATFGDEIRESNKELNPFYAPWKKESIFTDYKGYSYKMKGGYVSDVAFGNAFSDGGNFGKFLMQEVTNQIPILTAMVLSVCWR